MIKWEFSIEYQYKHYQIVKDKLKTGFYQELRFYVLPFMPEKFRGRVVYLPMTCEPEKTYSKQKQKIKHLEEEWMQTQDAFTNLLSDKFPEMSKLAITISPSFYGTIGGYELQRGRVLIKPRYDRTIVGVQKLLINALTHYYHFDYNDKMNTYTQKWTEKQNMAAKISAEIIKSNETRPMLAILDKQFVGDLAQKSIKYLKTLGYENSHTITQPINLTVFETKLFELLSQHQNTVIHFEEIGDVIWGGDSPEKYSEYAITKLAERLKKKLPKNSLHSQRGKGYTLYNP
jgi:hypothetical protein